MCKDISNKSYNYKKPEGPKKKRHDKGPKVTSIVKTYFETKPITLWDYLEAHVVL